MAVPCPLLPDPGFGPSGGLRRQGAAERNAGGKAGPDAQAWRYSHPGPGRRYCGPAGAGPGGTPRPCAGSAAPVRNRRGLRACLDACFGPLRVLSTYRFSIAVRSRLMTYVVTKACIKCKFMDCVEVCPVDCFYEGENMLVINPD